MSKKNLDQQGRLRSVIVSFRVSPEEGRLLNTKVALSGLTKQDYIIRRLTEQEITVVGSPRVYKALKDQLTAVPGGADASEQRGGGEPGIAGDHTAHRTYPGGNGRP